MIKQIKELCSKLHANLLGDFAVLDNREVCVIKAGSDYYISTRITESRHRAKDGRVKPIIDAPDERNRAVDIGAQSAGDSVDGGVGGDNVDRISALRLYDHGKLPSLH